MATNTLANSEIMDNIDNNLSGTRIIWVSCGLPDKPTCSEGRIKSA